MTEGKIGKTLLWFAVPLILGNLLQQTYNAVDSIIVGNYVGSNGLAAVGSSSALINLLIAFSQGLAVGAGILVAQAVGAGKQKRISRSVHTAIVIAFLLGILLSVLGFVLTPCLLRWMKTPKEVMRDSVSYLRIFSIGLVFNVVYNMEAGILNAVGNSKRSLLYLAAASATNIVLDLLFIRGLGLGVKGAAIATDVSQAVSCILALGFLLRVKGSYQVHIKELKIHKNTALRMIRVGLPTGIQNMVVSLSNVLVQSSINVFGPAAMAGFGAYMKVDGFNILPVLSLSMASTTFTGQNYGAGKLDRVRKGMWITLVFSVMYTIITGFILMTCSQPILQLFSRDRAVIEAGATAMKYFCPFYFLLAALHSLAGTVRGTGKTIPPMVILLVSLCAFRVAWLTFVLPLHHTVDYVYLIYPLSWGLGAVLMIGYTWKARWM